MLQNFLGRLLIAQRSGSCRQKLKKISNIRLTYIIFKSKSSVTMARPYKLTLDINKRIGDNVALGFTDAFAAEAAGITYQTFNDWVKKGKNSTSGEYFKFSKYIQKFNADAAKKLLERLNEATEAGNCQVCMWILSDVSRKIVVGMNLGKQMLFQRTRMKMLR